MPDPIQNKTQSPKAPSARLFLSQDQASRSTCDACVVALKDSWNDFGYSLTAEIGLRKPEGDFEWFPAKFAVKGATKLATFAQEILSMRSHGILLKDLRVPYASLLDETKHYSLARRALGADRARELLQSLNDIALLSDAGSPVPQWPDFFESEVYQLAMVRASESYFAVRHGAWVLDGRPTSETDARVPFVATLKGPGPNLALDFEFTDDNVLRGRIAVLIGQNGCGKTSALAGIARGLVDRKYKAVAMANRPEVNQVLAFAHTASLPLFLPKSPAFGSARVRVFSLDHSLPISVAVKIPIRDCWSTSPVRTTTKDCPCCATCAPCWSKSSPR